MTNRAVIGAGVLGLVLCAAAVSAQDVTRYRGFELGSPVATVATVSGVAESELRTIHQRPALIQELTWRPRYARQLAGSETESVDRVVFDFYDGRLFRMTVEYDRTATAGLSDADMVEALSAVYGPARTPVASRPRQPALGNDPGTTIAEWGADGNTVRLHRLPSYVTTLRLVITAEPIEALARTAAARAATLDASEAPQREAAREKQVAEERRIADEKARLANKGTFRP